MICASEGLGLEMVDGERGCAEKFRVVTVFATKLSAKSYLLIEGFRNGPCLEQR